MLPTKQIVDKQSMMDIFRGRSKDSIRRQTNKSSMQWMVNKIRQAILNPQYVVMKPTIGQMYLYVYDPKLKETLPYYDINPLVVPFQYDRSGFTAINFHYLPKQQREKLFEVLSAQTVGRTDTSKRMAITYKKIIALSRDHWAHAVKRYLYSHMRTRFILIPPDDWTFALNLPLAKFVGATREQIYSISRNK